MEAARFDAITKSWTRLPRRKVLRGLVAGTVSTLLGLGGREASARGCRRNGDCRKGKICRNRACIHPCGTPGSCGSGFPTCGSTLGCYCAKTPSGSGLCVGGTLTCPGRACTKLSDCSKGYVCGTGCCGAGDSEFACWLPC